MRVRAEAFGDGAWRATFPDAVVRPWLLHGLLRRLEGVVDAVVTERHALVRFDPRQRPVDLGRFISLVESWADRAVGEEGLGGQELAPREHVLPVRYDGPDLAEVAEHAGLSADEVVRRHAASTYVVAMIGFLPGFAYLRGLDPSLFLARRASPRPRVDASSVGIAGPYTGVYPFASPGGWNLVGTVVGAPVFDAATGARLALGDRVRFVPEPR